MRDHKKDVYKKEVNKLYQLYKTKTLSANDFYEQIEELKSTYDVEEERNFVKEFSEEVTEDIEYAARKVIARIDDL